MSNHKVATAMATSLLAATISSVTHAQDDNWVLEEVIVATQ